MTDGLDDDQEQGSDLPLPDDIDGPRGDPSSHTDPPGRLADSQQHEQTDAPDQNPADGDTAEGNLFGVEMALVGLLPTDLDSTLEREEEEVQETFEEAGPTREQLEAFDNLVHQSMLGVELADNLTLPWEQGIFRSVFGDAPIWEPAEIPLLSHSVPGYLERESSPLLEPEPATKRKKTGTTIHGLYDRAITFSNTLTDPELDKNKWARALEKLYTVFTICPQGCPAGITLDAGDMAGNLDKIRQLCGSRSPGTVSKRANSLLQYCKWHRKFFYQKDPFPLQTKDISEYIWERKQDGASFSTLSSFTEAVNFSVHVLGIPQKTGEPLVDKFTKGVIDQAALQRPGRKQARPLTVREVLHLEACIGDPTMSLYDRFAAGAFLFAVYARCRWSDVRKVRTFELDIALQNGNPGGYVSFTTFSHKTASQVAKHGLPLPLVAPIWGLESPPWALAWHRVSKEAQIDFEDHYQGPVLPAPLKSGKWGARSVTSKEASKWLNAILSKLDGPVEGISSHSLKCTTLSWLAKAGANENHRLVLGHHSSGKGSLEVYSRDLLAAPLRTLEEILRQIRVGALQPDKTRSGIVGEPTKQDCRDRPQGEQSGKPDSSSSSSSSSSTSDSEDEVSDEHEHNPEHWSNLLTDRQHEQGWNGKTMYQHKLSKVVHLETEQNSGLFQCGITASHEHEPVTKTLFLETRKCKRCKKAIGEI